MSAMRPPLHPPPQTHTKILAEANFDDEELVEVDDFLNTMLGYENDDSSSSLNGEYYADHKTAGNGRRKLEDSFDESFYDPEASYDSKV